MREADQKETLEIRSNSCLNAIFQLSEHVDQYFIQHHPVTVPVAAAPETVPRHTLTLDCAGGFRNPGDWVHTAQYAHDRRNAAYLRTLGSRYLTGDDFMRARDELTFPVRFGGADPADDHETA